MIFRAALYRLVTSLSRQQKRAAFLAVDATLGPVIAALVLLPELSLHAGQFWYLLPGLVTFAAGASIIAGLPRIKLNAYEIFAIFATAKYSALATFGFMAMFWVAGVRNTAVSLTEFFAALLCATVASRFFMLAALRWVLRNGQHRCRALIYGAGDVGQQVASALRNLAQIQILGFLDDNLDLQALTVAGLPVLSPDRAATLVKKLRIERVYLALPSLGVRRTNALSKRLQGLGLDVQTVPSIGQLTGEKADQGINTVFAPHDVLGRDAIAYDLPEMGSSYAGKVLLVTGAGGSVGSELCRQLYSCAPQRLVLFERSEIALYTIERELRDLGINPSTEIVVVLGSVTDAVQVRLALTNNQVDVVFHAAAYKHVNLVEANPVAGIANNVLGTRTIAEAAVAAGVGRFVLISTDKAVRPTSFMGGTKRLAELLVQDMAKRTTQTQFSIVRFGNVLGSSGSVLPRFREQIGRGGPVTLTDENVTRYFMTLTEAARLVLIAGAFFGQGDQNQASVFVLDMGQPVKIRDLAERMIAAAGLRPCTAENPHGDIEIVITGLRPGEKLHEELFIESQFLPTPHPKILRAHERSLSEFAVAGALNSARRAVASGDQQAARLVLQTWVEGFPQSPDACLKNWYSEQNFLAKGLPNF